MENITVEPILVSENINGVISVNPFILPPIEGWSQELADMIMND